MLKVTGTCLHLFVYFSHKHNVFLTFFRPEYAYFQYYFTITTVVCLAVEALLTDWCLATYRYIYNIFLCLAIPVITPNIWYYLFGKCIDRVTFEPAADALFTPACAGVFKRYSMDTFTQYLLVALCNVNTGSLEMILAEVDVPYHADSSRSH